jgi:RNA polymerase sigma factor (sigma-70 family)
VAEKCAASRFMDSAALTSVELPVVDQESSPFVEHQRSETIAQLGATIGHLPEKYRDVIVLRDLEDLSISEVAVRLDLTIAAVKTRHRRAPESCGIP